MTQAQTRASKPQTVDVDLTFKRFILEQSSDYSHEPIADLYRVNLLAEMLNRYDEIMTTGVTPRPAADRVMREYADISRRMREQGFERGERTEPGAMRWPELTESDAAEYMNESTRCQHKRTMGIALCVACLIPMMILMGLSQLAWQVLGWNIDNLLSIFGVCSMFGMIAMGVGSIVSAGKPKNEENISKGRFSLTGNLRRKLMQMQELMEQKSKKRRARGIGACICSVVPPMLLAAPAEAWSEALVMVGVAGMFGMIAYGVYEIVMSSQEGKIIKKLLKQK